MTAGKGEHQVRQIYFRNIFSSCPISINAKVGAQKVVSVEEVGEANSPPRMVSIIPKITALTRRKNTKVRCSKLPLYANDRHRINHTLGDIEP